MDYAEQPENLANALETMTVDSLKPLARHCTGQVPTRKKDLTDLIYRCLQDPAFVAAKVQEADATLRLALAEAAYGDGTVDQGRFYAKYGQTFTSGYQHWASPWAARPRATTAPLASLFFYNGRVPRELHPRLRALLPAPPDFVVTGHDSLPDTLSPGAAGEEELTPLLTEESALHDLLATLTLIGQGKLTIGETTHQPTAVAVRLLRERYLLPDVYPAEKGSRADDSIRPFALTMIAQAAGLARPHATRLALTKAGQAALDAPGPALLKRCWEAWVSWNKLDELSRVRGIKGQKAKGQRFTAPSSRKEAIADALAACPAQQWIAMADFMRLVRVNHDFDVEEGSYSHLYIGWSAEYGSLYGSGSGSWAAVVGSYIRVVLLEYAATLGLIDVAVIPPEEAALDFRVDVDLDDEVFSRYTGLAYLRVNALGRYILEQTAHYDGPTAPAGHEVVLRVLPNQDVVITQRGALTPNDRAILERFTTRVSDDVFRLSRQRLLDAVEDGLDVGAARTFLEKRSGADLPQTVGVLFGDIARSATAIQEVGPAILLRCAEPHVAQLIAHDSAAGKLCLRAGDDHLVVLTANLAAFRRGLKRLGYVLAGAKIST